MTSFNGQTITYDAIGNPLQYRDGYNFTWANGRQLSTVTNGTNSYSYTYNADGLRTSKTVNGTDITTYYWMGDVLQGEQKARNQGGQTVVDYYILYLYDENGTAYGFQYKTATTSEYYYYIFNAQGDVIGILDANSTKVVSYEYSAWGEVLSVTGTLANTIGQTNPIRYRGYYYDTETGFYYLQSRYYDTETCRWINADIAETLSIDFENYAQYNLFAYCFNNPVIQIDETGTWPSWTKKLVAAVTVVAVVATVAAITVATAGTGTAVACVAVGAAKGAAVGLASGAVSGAITGAVSHRVSTGSWKGSGNAALEGMGDGALSGAVTGAITGGATSKSCFVAGTSVLTAAGHVAIENIKADDLVWAENPDTGEKGLKRVVQTFVNDAYELVYVTVEGETIVCTTEHPFYSPVKGWMAACDLRAGDILVLVNGKYVVVEQIEHEILESPIKVYNFEVEDFHTYYVSDISVLVHNVCGIKNTPDQNAVIKIAKEHKKGITRTDANTLVGWAKEYGLNHHYPATHNGRSGIWGIVEHIKIFNLHIPIVK